VPYGDDSLLDEGFLDPTGCNGTNRADIFVTGHDDQALVTVRIDNLGKGASGAAIQCMNILCGLPELTSLAV
jgi:N-acetyl-gamma-glutamyl-phosphate reductase